MSQLQFPEQVSIQLLTWAGPITAPREVPFTGPSVAFFVRTFARAKNDYHLGPFFSERDRLVITRAQLQRRAAAVLDMGIMDYQDVRAGFALVEITHVGPVQIVRMIEYRAPELTRGSFFSAHDAAEWGTPQALLARLHVAGRPGVGEPIPGAALGIRDEWDGARAHYEYVYRLPQAALA